MRRTVLSLACGLVLSLPLLVLSPEKAAAQGGGQGRRAQAAPDTLSLEVKLQIREYYAANPVQNVEALPPGIRRNLERGKALPPGIAKKTAPQELQTQVAIAAGFELVEVGLDVFLIEVATGLIQDVLRDVFRFW